MKYCSQYISNKKIANWMPNVACYLEEIDKDLIYHLYCYYKEQTIEVYRETIDGKKEVRAGIWDKTGWMGGPHPLKTWGKTDSDYTWYEYSPTNRPNKDIWRQFIDKKNIIKQIPQLQYVWIESYERIDTWEFIKRMREYPQLEMIYKNEYLQRYWRYNSLYKLNAKELFALARFIASDPREKFTDENLNEMIYLIKHPEIRTAEQYENIKFYKCAKKIKNKDMFDTYGGDYKDLAQYFKKLIKNGIYASKEECIREYSDYLSLCKKLGIFGAFYPRDINKRIETLSKQVKTKENNEPLLTKKKLKFYNSHLIKNKTLTLSIPNTQNEFIKIGNKLDFCLGSCGYNEKQKEGKSLIVLFSVKNKPVECAELDVKHDFKLNQLYGYKDSTDGKYHKLARSLVLRYSRVLRSAI